MNKPRNYDRTPPCDGDGRKHKYDVYDFDDCYVGSAVAVSKAQACNLVRFRNRDIVRPNGGYADDYPMYAVLID